MNKKTINRILGVLLLAIAIFFGKVTNSSEDNLTQIKQSKSALIGINKAYADKKSDIQVRGSGSVIKVLKDDTKGHKHQKFILRLETGISILIAHNIDLAPRIKGIKKGDIIEFYGEYEYNNKGGVVHWTHHDPNHRHKDGWLKYKGKIYQ